MTEGKTSTKCSLPRSGSHRAGARLAWPRAALFVMVALARIWDLSPYWTCPTALRLQASPFTASEASNTNGRSRPLSSGNWSLIASPGGVSVNGWRRAKGRCCARRKITSTLPGRHKTLPTSAITKPSFARCSAWYHACRLAGSRRYDLRSTERRRRCPGLAPGKPVSALKTLIASGQVTMPQRREGEQREKKNADRKARLREGS